MILGLGFLWVFWGFLGFFYFQIFHAVILYNEYKQKYNDNGNKINIFIIIEVFFGFFYFQKFPCSGNYPFLQS